MIKHIIAIYDRKAGTYSDPKTFTTSAVAVRAFIDLMDPDKNQDIYAQHPDDFALVAIGTFNDTSGELCYTSKDTLITGLEAQGIAIRENLDRAMRRKKQYDQLPQETSKEESAG